MPEDWSKKEAEIIIADYFSMLRNEIEGKPYNKSHHRKLIQPLLNNRTDGSIEFKHQNISAVLATIGIPYINGYKPAWNYQKSLEENVQSYITNHLNLKDTFNAFAQTPIIETSSILSFNKILETPPERKPIVHDSEVVYKNRNLINVNYLEMEQGNTLVGYSGEKIVFEYERWRLISEGKDNLAAKVEWVSQTRGDGLGFDILSRNNNGTDKYIEVKSTKLTKEAPIFFSKNEYDFSLNNSANYNLYRVFNLNHDPKLFIVNGRFDDFCKYESIKFKGYF